MDFKTKILFSGKDRIQKESLKEIGKLNSLAQGSDTVVYKFSSVFPFQLFPDKVIIDLNKITIVRHNFLYKRTIPILFEDILLFKVTKDLFFASVNLEIRGYEQNPRSITFLKPHQATLAETYVLGIIRAKNEKIDLSQIPIQLLRIKLKEIGIIKG